METKVTIEIEAYSSDLLYEFYIVMLWPGVRLD